MGVIAGQLVQKIAVEGDDSARSKLSMFGKAVDQAHQSLASKLVSGTKSAAGGFLSFGSQVGMAIFGFKQLAESAVGLVGAMLSPNAAMEQTTVAFTTILHSGDAATKMMKDLQNFAASTPFEFPELANSAKKMLAFGFSADSIMPMLRNVGDAVSALGGGAFEIDRVSTALGQMQAKGKVSAEEMMQLAELGIPAWDMLAKGMGVTTAEAMKMSENGLIPAGKAIDILVDGMGKTFGGGMQAQSMTFNGLLSTFKDNIMAAWRAFTGPMFEAAKSGLTVLGGLVSAPAFQNFATGAGQRVADTFGLIGEGVTYVSNILRSLNLTDFNEAWQSIGIVMGDIERHISGALAPAFALLKTDADPIAELIGNLARGGLSILTDLLWNISGALMEFDKELVTGKGPLIEFAAPIQKLAGILQGEFTDSFKFASDQAKQISTWFQGSGIIGDVGQDLKSLASVAFNLAEILFKARGAVIEVGEHAFAKFAPYVEKLLPPLIKFQTAIDTGIAGALQYVKPYVEDAIGAFQKFADGVIDRITPIIDKYLPYLIKGVEETQKAFEFVWPYLAILLKGVFDMMAGSVQIAWSLISGIILIGLDLLSGNWGKAWEDMWNMLGGVWEGIKRVVGGGVDAARGILDRVGGFVDSHLVQPFRNALGSIGGIFGSIGKLIGDATSGNWGAIPGDLHALHIPGFASGTNFAPGGPALVGERGPELVYLPRGARVVPAAQTQQMMQQPQIIVNLPDIVLDGQRLTRAQMPYIVNGIRLATGAKI